MIFFLVGVVERCKFLVCVYERKNMCDGREERGRFDDEDNKREDKKVKY